MCQTYLHLLSDSHTGSHRQSLVTRHVRRVMTAAEKSKDDLDIDDLDVDDLDVLIEDVRLGVWKLRIDKTTGYNLDQWWKDIKSAVPLYCRLFSDIFTLAPRLFTFFVFCQVWQGVEDALLLHFSSLLLRRVCHDWLYSPRGLFNSIYGI